MEDHGENKGTVNLSIKNVPIDIAEKLRNRARYNHRSLQGELMAILEASVASSALNPKEVLAKVRATDSGQLSEQVDSRASNIIGAHHVNLRR